MRLITYYYYISKKKIKGKCRLSNRIEKSFNFDTNIYRDEKNNYNDVISDYLDELNIKHYKLTIIKVSNIL